jgi:glucose-1-phosphate adenylyltransferase
MNPQPSTIKDPEDSTIAVIMGGGAGSRLFPLTKDRSKPAVPLGGKYRLVDVPISNCLNSGLRRVYVLTQFNSTSLHRHIQASYKFDNFTQSFVEILAAQQTPEGGHWYQGTADAVRQNLRQLTQHDDEYVLILSGDQLYRMDYRDVIEQHVACGSDITIATIPVSRSAAPGFGIMHTHPDRKIFRFVEKPAEGLLLDELRIPQELLQDLKLDPAEDLYQASMGIYVFNRKVLVECLDNDFVDFGKNVIPMAIEKYQVNSFIFQGYWEDVGTIRAYFDATLNMAAANPHFSFFNSRAPVYTHPRFLPASKFNAAMIRSSIISDGCIISDATLDRCLVGIRSVIGSGSTLRNSIIMGSDFYEADLGPPTSDSVPAMGIGRNCVIERCIVDKNARIGDGVVITPEGKPDPFDGDGFYVRDGIVVIPKNGVVAHGRWV